MNFVVPKYSVVICAKNESLRIADCINLVLKNQPDEIIVVDGDSVDNTREIVKTFPGIKLIHSKNSNLTKDRQIGIDASINEYVAMIDADHRPNKNDLGDLLKEMIEEKFDVIQSGLLSYKHYGFWDIAEEETWRVVQNIPGPRVMVGTAPAIYKKSIFKYVKFDDRITKTIDDTDFSYQLSKVPGAKFGVGSINVCQYHFSDFAGYIKKFKWYGRGDGEFCLKNPERSLSMFFHLFIRYPIIYPIKAFRRGCFRAPIFFIIQGYTRFYSMVKVLIKSKAT